MFRLSSKVRLKNFFAVCDVVAESGSSDRKSIAKFTGISPQTVTKAVEFLLDAGLLNEISSKRPFIYSLSTDRTVGVIDLSCQKFTFSVYTLDGTLLHNLSSQYNPSYFYDENLSFFLHEAAAFLKTRMPHTNFTSVTELISPSEMNLRGTRSILSDTERLVAMTASYFGKIKISTSGTISASQNAIQGNPMFPGVSVICTNDGNSAVCTAVSDSIPVGTTLLRDMHGFVLPSKSVVNTYRIQDMAGALGNVIGMLTPNRLFIDAAGRPGDITESRVREVLSDYLGTRGVRVPEIIMLDKPISHIGAVRCARIDTVRKLTEECAVGS